MDGTLRQPSIAGNDRVVACVEPTSIAMSGSSTILRAHGARAPRAAFVLLAVACLHLSSGCRFTEEAAAPRARLGTLDLRDWDFAARGPVSLQGEHELYWGEHLEPGRPAAGEPTLLEAPRSWNGHRIAGKAVGGSGYATYRLTVLLPEEAPQLGLKLLDMGTAFEVLANGVSVTRVGEPGTTAASTRPRYRPQVVELPAASGSLELLYRVSNFHHRRGGAWEAVRIGPPRALYRERSHRLILDAVLFGAISIMGLYHLVLYALRREDRTTLYLGVFCLLIAVRLSTTVERMLTEALPSLPWPTLVRLEYLSAYAALPAFTSFLRWAFPDEIHRRAATATAASTALLAAVVVATPTRVFTATLVPFQFVLIAAIVYGLVRLVAAVRRGREGASIVLLGFVLLAAAVVNDILDANTIIQTSHFVHHGLFAFILCQSALLAARTAKAYRTVLDQRRDLAVANDRYRDELHERTRAETVQAELREQLARAHRMEAVGLLAGGVAHDLNNLLSPVVGYPDLLMTELPATSPLRGPLGMMRSSGLQAAAVIEDLLALARRGALEREPVDLVDVVVEYLESPEHERLRRDHPEVEFRIAVSDAPLRTMGSSSHLSRAVSNLVSNAARAHTGPGVVAITTSDRYLERPLAGYETILPGGYVVLTVRDHGVGIAREHLANVFEPFYVKKVLGRGGSGLGMAVVWGVVRDHQGAIDLESVEGVGTKVELYLPITHQASARPPALESRDLRGRNETILVVDDLDEQRRLASEILERLGYRVVTVASGEEAVDLARDPGRTVDLCLLDMILGDGMDGLETARSLTQERPGIRIVIATGYAEGSRLEEALRRWAGGLLRKPYTLHRIAQVVRDELDRAAGPQASPAPARAVGDAAKRSPDDVG